MGDAYDQIGRSYADTRRTDPRIAARIEAALGDATSVANVGAGTGSYEPGDRVVTAFEPSSTMIGQRRAGSAPVVEAGAESLPTPAASFDAAMAILTIHHWDDARLGVEEMRRWGRPELILDPEIRASTSGFARMDPACRERAVARLRADLDSGEWDRRYGTLRRLDTYDVGLRLVVSGT